MYEDEGMGDFLGTAGKVGLGVGAAGLAAMNPLTRSAVGGIAKWGKTPVGGATEATGLRGAIGRGAEATHGALEKGANMVVGDFAKKRAAQAALRGKESATNLTRLEMGMDAQDIKKLFAIEKKATGGGQLGVEELKNLQTMRDKYAKTAEGGTSEAAAAIEEVLAKIKTGKYHWKNHAAAGKAPEAPAMPSAPGGAPGGAMSGLDEALPPV